MAMTLFFNDDEISDLDGYWLGAEARLGDNGDIFGTREVRIRTESSVPVDAFCNWDGEDWDGIDTGDVPFTLTAADGIMTWTVAGTVGGAISYNGGTFTDLDKVQFRIGVQGPGYFEFGNVQVHFYDDSTLVDSYVQEEPLVIDTLGYPDPGIQEKIADVYTEANGVDEVTIEGYLRFSVNEMSAPDQVFGEIFLYA